MIWRRGHPWLFMLAFGTTVAALWSGSFLVAVVAAAGAWWTLRA